jgi:hypothetical protein
MPHLLPVDVSGNVPGSDICYTAVPTMLSLAAAAAAAA